MKTLLRSLIVCLVAVASAASAAAAPGNKVEPLSNGLRLAMTQEEIQQQFGPPTESTWDARSFGYGSFFVQCGGARHAIWHLTLKPGVRLACGVGSGSSRAEVQAAFGADTNVRDGQYKLSFTYGRDDRVQQIRIDPANDDFVDYRGTARTPTAGITATELVGSWPCIVPSSTVGTLELQPGGTYRWSGRAGGRYRISGRMVIFDGALKPWNAGRATLEKGNLVFAWTNADGQKNYFVFTHAR